MAAPTWRLKLQQQGSKINLFEEYLGWFRDKSEALEQSFPLNSPCGAQEGRWHAQGGWARHYPTWWPCPLPGAVLLPDVLSSDKNHLRIFLIFSGNIFYVTFSKTQKQ